MTSFRILCLGRHGFHEADYTSTRAERDLGDLSLDPAGSLRIH